jgi:hypothetical protein
MIGGHHGVARRIMITMRFRVGQWREIRRVERESVMGSPGEVFAKLGWFSNLLFLEKIKCLNIFHFPS